MKSGTILSSIYHEPSFYKGVRDLPKVVYELRERLRLPLIVVVAMYVVGELL